MPYNNNNNNENENEQQPQINQPPKQSGGMAKQQVKKAVNQVGKQVKKALGKAITKFFTAIVLPLLPYLLAFFVIVIIIYLAWDLIFNNRGKSQDYQTEDTQEYNSLEKKEETGEILATDLSFGNKVVKAFYTYFSEKSIYITCPDEGVDEPIQWNSPEFIGKFGENGETEGFKDKYGREKMFYISPNSLWSLDEFLNKGDFRFPEQFVLPVSNEGKDGDYALKHLTDDRGELIAQSQKYEDTEDKLFEKPIEDETEDGVWDYGFGSILNYKKFTEQAKQVGTYTKQEVWNPETQQIETVPIENGQSYEKMLPEREKVVYMIDRVTAPAGNITNPIEQVWEDTGETFETTISRTETVTIKNEDGTTTTKTITLKTYISGTIWEFVPKYTGAPDTSQISGNRYYRDYIRYYTTYAPESVLTQFDFRNMRDRTGKTAEELLELLERESFGGSSNGGSGGTTPGGSVDLGDFQLGSGASSQAYKNAMQYFEYFEKYGNMYGVDPYLLVAIACQESSGNHSKYISTSRCQKAGCGLMQIEQPGITIKSATAYNQETGQEDKITVTYSLVTDVEMNIKVGAMLQSDRMRKQQYNILIGLQSYNFGEGAFNKALNAYCKATGKTRDQVLADPSDTGWLEYVKDLHNNPQKYIPSWGYPTYGDDEYIAHVLRYYASPDNTGIWVQKEDGSKVILNPDGTFEIGSSTGGGGGSGSGGNLFGWLSKIWSKIKDGWKSLFPDLPEELAEERTKFEHKVPETQIDTIIKMMFVMEERKYLIEYDDFDDEDWKEKFTLLFSNPLGNGWGGGSTPTVDVNSYFPNGYVTPLDLSPLTIKTPYSTSHTGIDIVAPKGTTVRAVADGEVVEVSDDISKGGKYIRIKHEGEVYTLYGNLDTVSVSVGDKVTKGQSIGTTGSSSKGDVLHFELSKGTVNEDPTWIVSGFFNAEDYNMTEEDAQVINQIIALAKSKIGLPYMWGAKGEIMTQENMNRLFRTYGRGKYPLPDSAYLGKQAFDCSGFTKWLYMQVTGMSIGDGTKGQEPLLRNYKVSLDKMQPGDIIFSDGHVVLYIGNGRIIHASNSQAYPKGGVKEDNRYAKLNRAYRPIAYLRAKGFTGTGKKSSS